MKQFYRELLRVQPSNQNSTDVWALFENGDLRFALHAIPARIVEKLKIDFPPLPRESDPIKLIFEVKDVEAERERLESLGIRTIRRPWQKIGEECDAVDPEGNVIQICSSRDTNTSPLEKT